MVTVRVGAEKADFAVHQNLLCKNSPFFDAALRNDWTEAETRVVPLPEARPEVFSVYQSWLLQQTIFSAAPEQADEEWSILIEAYVLGERLGDVNFKDAIMDAVLEKRKEEDTVPTTQISTIYEGTPTGSSLRKWIVDMIVRHGTSEWFDCETAHRHGISPQAWLIPDFSQDCVRALMSKLKDSGEAPEESSDDSSESEEESSDSKEGECKYHEHVKEGRPCYNSLDTNF